MSLESVGDLALNLILSKLEPEDSVRVSCVSKRFRISASEDSLWSKFCLDDLDLHSPLDPHGNPLPTFKETYQLWRDVFNMYPWPLVKRVKRCWDGLKNWFTINFPEAKATLRKGASEADICELENKLKVKLPVPTRILYRFCDGQDFAGKVNHMFSFGLIGGYSFYGHSVNVYLLPLSRIILETEKILRHTGFASRSKYILVAASLTAVQKLFFLNCLNGQLYVGTMNLFLRGEMIPCVPDDLINLENQFDPDKNQDAMLLWLEEHSRRLQNGIIKTREEENIRSINLFPEEPPLCSTAVTNGVKVRASSVFVPEAGDLQDYVFAYSIRMSLMPGGCIINGRTFSSCQLHRRHWFICAHNAIVSEVHAEAVIGMFPLLRPGEKEFVYESCTPLRTSRGSIRGSFTFVPGSLEEAKGAPFEVEVAEFPLRLPDYIF